MRVGLFLLTATPPCPPRLNQSGQRTLQSCRQNGKATSSAPSYLIFNYKLSTLNSEAFNPNQLNNNAQSSLFTAASPLSSHRARKSAHRHCAACTYGRPFSIRRRRHDWLEPNERSRIIWRSLILESLAPRSLGNMDRSVYQRT